MKGVTSARKDKNMAVLAQSLDLEHHLKSCSSPVYEDLSADDDLGRYDEGSPHYPFGGDHQTQHHLVSMYSPLFEF